MLKYWLWLTTRQGLGHKGAMAALQHFGTPEQAFFAPDYDGIEGLDNPEPLLDKSLEEPERILGECYRRNIHILTYQDAAYPERLRNIDDPPLLLYYQGVLPAVDTEPVIAMVGTRHASVYGLVQAKQLGFQLGRLGAIVVSGGADGIDTLSLTGALSSGRPVIAVLGGGVDVVYPAKNRSLFEDIRYHGCLLSEYPPGTPALGAHFPVRNRIISGLAQGVLVVEAPKKSGALITASRALEQGRDVFTLPANIGTATCEGNLQLLKEGAILVEEGWDVMKEYVHLYPELVSRQSVPIPMTLTGAQLDAAAEHGERLGGKKAIPRIAENIVTPEKSDTKDVDKPENRAYIDVQEILETLSADEKAIVELLVQKSRHIDDIIDESQIPAGRVLAAMTMLEIKGYVKRLPVRMYSLAEKK